MNKKNYGEYSYYFPMCLGAGIIIGSITSQIPLGLILGTGIGLALDYKKK